MKLKTKLFIHQNIPYSFNWNKQHHKNIYSQITSNREELNKLKLHFKRVYNGLIPNYLFNSRNLPRISQFKIRGIKSAFIKSFSKKLIRTGQIELSGSNSKLPQHAQNVMEIFKVNKIQGIPGHEPILKNILIKDKNSIAIEVPVWNEAENKLITGHIDLIQVENDVVKVIDYKPEGNFLYSLPQVAMYGFLLKEKLKIKNLKCISFNKHEAWEYDPLILLSDIKDYLISHRINERPWEDYL
ncbi:MAG: hypothetical protein ACFFE4_07985 [Candidatus Thorarchaeota archaeon]